MDVGLTARRLGVALVALACLALAAPAGAVELRPVRGHSKAKVGIAEQKAEVFADERFANMGVGYVRRTVAWDTLHHADQTAELDAWIEGARRVNAEPMISFARSFSEKFRHRPPDPLKFERQFLRFRQRYPEVRTYSSWNEANHCGEGTCRRPRLVAAYYRSIRRNCPGCKVLAAELLDQPNLVTWARDFRRAARIEPRYWGLHNYVGANRMDDTRTIQLLRAVRGEVWLTETGGVVARRNNSTTRLPVGRSHAAVVTRYIFDHLARLSPRVTRVYIYHWSSTSNRDSWDSALVGSDGRARPALAVLQRVLRRAGITGRRPAAPAGPASVVRPEP